MKKMLLKANHLTPTWCAGSCTGSGSWKATLKPGKRHLYHKQVFYLDEDSWAAALADKYDGRGQLYRVGMNYLTQQYDVPCLFPDSFSIHDLITNSYAINALPAPGQKGILIPAMPSRRETGPPIHCRAAASANRCTTGAPGGEIRRERQPRTRQQPKRITGAHVSCAREKT